MLVNRGRIALTGGANLTLPAAANRLYTQEGILELGVNSVFTVNGNMIFAGTSQPVVQPDLGSLNDAFLRRERRRPLSAARGENTCKRDQQSGRG